MLYSPALAQPFEEHNAARFLCIADVEESVELKGQEELQGTSSASLVYAGYPYDPYA
jgi:hypothetical protein